METKMTDKRGYAVLHDRHLNKSTAFTEQERDELGLRGLLPPAVGTQRTQLSRVLENLRRKRDDIERYVFLMALQSRNERLFLKTILDNIEETLPLIYTPTVGQACLEFAHIYRQERGLYVTANDRGRIAELLSNWPSDNVKVIVITDGQRILGLGDLGANGMGIPVGKLALYAACAGIDPADCLPVMLDVGTDNKVLCQDPLYLGLNQPRLTGDDYLDLVDEFVAAVRERWGNALIQFEDFATPNAYGLLNRYRDKTLCFNDDIQGTAAVATAGVLAASGLAGTALEDMRIVFLGAGSAATGIADLLVPALEDVGLSNEEARRRLWFVDVNGLLHAGRDDLLPHNLPYAHEHEPADFIETLRSIKPHALIGATGAPGLFTREVLELMAALHERPIVFALSNPTSRAECTAEEAYRATQGRAIFASGSPFGPVNYGGRTLVPGQGNNVYIFPGIGLGAVAVNASGINDAMFLAAAKALAARVDAEALANGTVYPALTDIRAVSLDIAVAVAEVALASGLAENAPSDLRGHIAALMHDPTY
ncbi:MAG: NAD-dependent malic enzyme [Pseudomonadota bacterium]